MKSLMLFILLSGLATNQAFAQTPDDVVSSFFQDFNQPTAVASGTLQKAAIKAKPSRELTPILMFAKTNWDALSKTTQTQVSPFFLRPTDGAIINLPGGQALTPFTQAEESTYLSPLGYFRFHYVTSGTNAATLAFVQQLATEADNVWATEIVTMGYSAPPSDGSGGGDAKYDIYLLEVGSTGVYGYVTSDATTASGPYPRGRFSHMVVDNDFSGFPQAPLEAAKVTLAHEFFHSIQFGYDPTEFPAFLESSATWMEDKVYPTIKDNLQYIGEPFVDANGDGQYSSGETFTDRNGNGLRESGSQDYPELHLDSFGLSENGLEQYGRFMWIRYLSDKHGVNGDALIKNILTKIGQTAGNNTYAAIDTALQAAPYNTTLAAAFHEFGIWNIDILKYQSGTDYPIAWGDRSFNNGAINISNDATQSLRNFGGKQKHLSTIYELVNNPNATYTFTSTGSVQLSAMTQSTTGGAYTIQAIVLTGGQGSWSAPAGTIKVTFVISNTSPTDDTMTWRLTDGVSAPLPALSASSSSGNVTTFSSSSSGGLCFTSIASWQILWSVLLLIPAIRHKRKYR
ncbi:MAG: hypothetical protein Q9M44_05995 [Ghiorsea sp.]|nr:hypothetical protein [Ghiorsea sp.]